jgi:molybdate transport system substrate-binding protein
MARTITSQARSRVWIHVCALLLLVSSSHFGSSASAQTASTPVLSVFAASSLQTVLSAAGADWQRETGRRVTFSFGATPALARQIEQGAPADIFASADIIWMEWAEARGLVRRDTRRVLDGGRLVLVTRRDDPVALKIAPGFPLLAALDKSRLATANPQSVPLGRYAQAALTKLGVWAEIAPRIAAAENARQALSLVARGEARFGIVYSSDALHEPQVRIVDTFAADLHPPIVYPFAATVRSVHPDAKAFLDYLVSPAAQRIFAAQGFGQAR